MILKFENLGPIRSAQLKIKPMTVICGPNNSGKTFLSYSTYGIFRNAPEQIVPTKMRDIAKTLKNQKLIKIDKYDFIENLRSMNNENTHDFSNNLHSIFSGEKKDFKNSKASLTLDEVDFQSVKIKRAGQQFQINDMSFKFEEIDNGQALSVQTSLESDDNYLAKIPDSLVARLIGEAISECFTKTIFRRPFLLPAERTGVSLFFKDLDFSKNALVEALQGLKEKDLKPYQLYQFLDSTTSRYAQPIHKFIDFVRDFERLQKKEGQVYAKEKALKDVIDDFIGGRFFIENGKYVFTNFKRGDNKFTIPLYMASQFLKSMFPLISYIKHSLEYDDLIIIDEPELNLHPDNQKLLMRLLCMLSNLGVHVLITTHSDHMIQELQVLTLANKLKDTKQEVLKKYGIDSGQLISDANISFNSLNDGRLKEILFDEELGFDVESISQTINSQNSILVDLAE